MRENKQKRLKNKRASISSQVALTEDMWRFEILWILVAIAFILLISRAYYLQIAHKEFLQDKSNEMAVSKKNIPAMRGMILDRNGLPLAVSSPVETVILNIYEYHQTLQNRQKLLETLKKEPNNKKAKRELANIKVNFDVDLLARQVGIDAEKLKQDIKQHTQDRYYVLKSRIPPVEAEKILALKVAGVYSDTSYKRYYPQAEPNAQIVGLTNNSDVGIEGMEMKLNDRLAGVDGIEKILRDGRRNEVRILEEIRPVKAGEDVVLSIDSRLQYIMYRELAAAGVANNARSATAIAVDIKTGEILAMNSWPSYNPNDAKDLNNKKDAMRNRGAIDSFEPGSTMKPFTVLLAMEQGKFNEQSMINTSPGRKLIGGKHLISDTHNYGALSLKGILVKSSNVGVATIALALPRSALPQFYKKIGFGQRSAVDFPGESAGVIKKPSEWNEATIATMSYGYGINTTILQLAQAYAMIANHGVEVPLTLFKRTEAVTGQQMVRREIADRVLLMLEAVTQPGGTAQAAVVSGYRVGGKTGTAHKLSLDGKKYSNTEYRALFAGVAPISNPRIALVVVVENPQGKHYGGLVAAPVFAKIMQESLRLLNVPLDATSS